MSNCSNIQNILQGADSNLFEIEVTDSLDMPIPLTSMVDYQAYVYSIENNNKKKLWATFMKEPVGTAFPIIVAGTYSQGFILPRDKTINMPCGDYYLESKIKLTASSYYESSEQNSGVDGFLLCRIIESAQPKLMT